MHRLLIKLILTLLLLGSLFIGNSAEARSLGDFLKALGNSIVHPHQPPPPQKKMSKQATTEEVKTTSAAPTPTATPTDTPAPPTTTLAASAAPKSAKRDVPYGIPVPNKPGFVTSPYAPKQGFVDVRGFPSGIEVTDPYSGRIFLTP